MSATTCQCAKPDPCEDETCYPLGFSVDNGTFCLHCELPIAPACECEKPVPAMALCCGPCCYGLRWDETGPHDPKVCAKCDLPIRGVAA